MFCVSEFHNSRFVEYILNETDFITELNKDDYNYINIILEKTRINLEKAFDLLKK